MSTMNFKQGLFFLLPVAALAFACSSTSTVVQQQPGGGTPDAGTSSGSAGDDDAGESGDDAGGGTQCTAAAKKLLGPVSTASTAEVKVIETAAGVTKLYVDASAGGQPNAAKNARVYIKMDGTKAELSDVEAATSTEWDLALKRIDIFTNGGDGGPGKGAGVVVQKAFADVTKADADGIAQESFFSGDCEPKTDEAGFLLTTFSGWYDYDDATHIPTPFLDRSIVVKSADGTLYAVGILAYQGKSDGATTGGKTGEYVLQVKKL